MALAGERLSPRAIARLCWDAGWRDENLITAVCIVLQESAGFTEATHENNDGSMDNGLWQINNKAHPNVTQAVAFDPAAATKVARALYKDQKFRPWAAYTTGAYMKHRDRATRGMVNMWREQYGLDLLTG